MFDLWAAHEVLGEGDGTPLQYSCLENPMDGGAWWAAVLAVVKSRTRLSYFTFTFHSCIGEGNGIPLQCSCLENPRDGGAWWAAVYGVAQSDTRLNWLSSSMRYWLTKLFNLFNSLQMPNSYRMVAVEFLGSFSCNCKRINLDDCSQMVIVNFRWLATVLLTFKALLFSLCSTSWTTTALYISIAVLGPNALLILGVVSTALQRILNS